MKITEITIKQTKNGDDYKLAKLDGVVHGKDTFSTFQFHTLYSDVEVGAEFPDNAFEMSGDYLGLVDPNKSAPRASQSRSGDIKVAQEYKREGIKSAQDNRSKGIKISGAMRDATLVTTKLMELVDPNLDVKITWASWRDWFMAQYDEKDNEVPPPF